MLKKTLLAVLALIAFVTGGCFALESLNKAQYTDAPMTMAMYEYLKSIKGTDAKETDKALEQIVEQYIPVGTTIEEALGIATKNHFECHGPLKEKLLNPRSDEEYGCAIKNILGKNIFVSSNLGFWVHVRQGKVINYTASYDLYGM